MTSYKERAMKLKYNKETRRVADCYKIDELVKFVKEWEKTTKKIRKALNYD